MVSNRYVIAYNKLNHKSKEIAETSERGSPEREGGGGEEGEGEGEGGCWWGCFSLGNLIPSP